MTVLTTFLLLVPFISPYSYAAGFELAQPVPQLLGRQDFIGGWAVALTGTTCPSDATVSCKTSNPACCPSGTKCWASRGYYCCPGETDCEDLLENFPQCADPKWTLYVLSNSALYGPKYFCCPPEQFGVLPLSGYGGFCRAAGEVVPESRIASPAGSPKTSSKASTSTLRTSTSKSDTSRSPTSSSSNAFTSTPPLQGANQSSNPSPSQSLSAPPPPASNTSIGPGAIAGIVIGALGVLALLLLAFVFYRRGRPQSQVPVSVIGGEVSVPAYTPKDTANYPIPVKSPTIGVVGAQGEQMPPPPPADWVPPAQDKVEVSGQQAPSPPSPQWAYGTQSKADGRAEMDGGK